MIELVKKEDKIVVFGLGLIGKWFINEIGSEKVAYIIDNNKSLVGSIWMGIEVISLERYLEVANTLQVVISTVKYAKEIISELSRKEIDNYLLYSEYWINSNCEETDGGKEIYLVNTHCFSNIGDYAITYATKRFLKDKAKEFRIKEIPAVICQDGTEYLKKYINENAIILLSGGGYLGSLWLDYGENSVRKIIKNFQHNKIIILPQTLYFSENIYGKQQLEITKEIYNKADKLTVCLRETKSFELAKEIFASNIKCILVPDLVLYLKPKAVSIKGEKIGFCFRNDSECVLSDKDKKNIYDFFSMRKEDFVEITMISDYLVNSKGVNAIVENKISELMNCELVITDRLHCMLLCAVAGIPCVAFDNLSGKVSGVYRFIEDLPYIRTIKDKTDIVEKLKGIFNKNKIHIEEQSEHRISSLEQGFLALEECIFGKEV